MITSCFLLIITVRTMLQIKYIELLGSPTINIKYPFCCLIISKAFKARLDIERMHL